MLDEGRKSKVRLVGEYGPAPAPAKIVPVSAWVVFHCNLAVYGVPAATVITVCTSAALGENVPPKPPLSFQASGCPAVVGNAPPLTVMPRSWLKPALEVQRSALPLMMAYEATLGVKMTLVLPALVSTQVVPLLPVRLTWLVLQPDERNVNTSALDVGLVTAPVGNVTSTGPAACA